MHHFLRCCVTRFRV